MGTSTSATAPVVQDDRAHVRFSARWHPLPHRVFIGGVQLLKCATVDEARRYRDRLNAKLTVSVLRR